MFYRKIFIVVTIITSLIIISGCAKRYAPVNYLPETEKVPEDAFGGWITLVMEGDRLPQNKKPLQYGGEFIAVDENVVYVLNDSLLQIPKQTVFKSILEVDKKETATYGYWTFFGTLISATHGVFFAVTAPLWLSIGISATIGESERDRYEIEHPDEDYWEEVKKYSRFPQGVSNIDLTSLKPKEIPEEE
jgi:hypothetical protein